VYGNTSRKGSLTKVSDLSDLETSLQSFVGKTISEIRFFKEAGMLEIGFTDGGTLSLPLAARPEVK
jgi:hypothetical protein